MTRSSEQEKRPGKAIHVCERANALRIASRHKWMLFAISVLATCGYAKSALAQQPGVTQAATQVCSDTLVTGNMHVLFRRYLAEHEWLNLGGLFYHDTNEKVTNSQPIHSTEKQTVCRASLSLDFLGARNDTRHVDVRDLDFEVISDKGRPATIGTYDWPTEHDHDRTGDLFLARWTINGKPMLPQIKAAIAAAPKPANIMDAMSMMNGAARAQAEQIARQQGFGGMLDAEAARRARLTPKKRAAEDAYSAGPGPGETICIVKEGVRRCKTGR